MRETHKNRSYTEVAAILCGGLAFAYPAYLALMYRSHDWILAAGGRPAMTDFLVFWLAGQFAVHGAAATAYDPHVLHAAQAAAIGHSFSGAMPWRYMPHFFFAIAPLAWLPYVSSFLVWVLATLAAYAFAISRIAGKQIAMVLACATPAVFINAICGQNGPFTAALIAGALLTIEERPVLSGMLLGLLSYKPQFGILFPLALIAGGYWRAFFSAVLATLGAALASALVFGPASLLAFVHFLPITSNTLLIHGANGFSKLQTVYGLFRWLGYSNASAWVAQGSVVLAVCAGLVWLWRKGTPFAYKAAALATGCLLATPHLFPYDCAVLVVALAFLYRERAFDTVELLGIGIANLCIGAFLFFPSPICLVACAIAAGLIARRVCQSLAVATPAPPKQLQPAGA